MTSKISYIRLIRENIRHRGWFAALTWIIFFFMLPVYLLLQTDLPEDTVPTASWIYNVFAGMLNGAAFWPLLGAIILLGFLSAFTGFSYVHSKEQLDFYHSFPVKRRQWFAISYLSGLVLFVVPYVVCSAFAIIAAFTNQVMDAPLFQKSVCSILGGIFAFLLVYHVSILAIMLTGRTVTGVLASLVIAFYPALISLVSPLESLFFDSYYQTSSSLFNQLSRYFAPGLLAETVISLSAQGTVTIPLSIAVIGLNAVLIAAAFLLYRRYPSEAAGNALAFPATAPVIKVMICIPASLFSGLVIQSFAGVIGRKWMIILSLMTAVLLCAVIEFIYRLDMRMIFKNWISSLISIAGVAVILCILQFDLFGYDTYLPPEDQLESISFRPNAFTGYFTYPEEITSDTYTEYFVQGDDLQLLSSLVEDGIRNMENGITPNSTDMTWDDADAQPHYLSTVFQYRLESGKVITRRYSLSQDQLSDALEALCQKEDFRRELFPIFHVDRSLISSIHLRDAYLLDDPLRLDPSQMDRLLDAYEEDVLAVDISTLEEDAPIGAFSLYLDDSPAGNGEREASSASLALYNSEVTLNDFYIYESYANTLAYLEELGYTLRTKIEPEDVSSITFYLTTESMEEGAFDEMLGSLSVGDEYASYPSDESFMMNGITVTSQEDIRILLEHMTWDCSTLFGDSFYTADYADIVYANGEERFGFYLR